MDFCGLFCEFCGFKRKHYGRCNERERHHLDGEVHAEPRKDVFDRHDGVLRNGRAVEKQQGEYRNEQGVCNDAERGGKRVYKLIGQYLAPLILLVGIVIFRSVVLRVCTLVRRVFEGRIEGALICGLAHIFIIARAFHTRVKSAFLKPVSREIANHRNEYSRQYADERILKNRRDGGRGFRGEPRDIVDNSHHNSHCERGLERSDLRKNNRRQNHKRKGYRAELHRNETKDYRQCEHKREKGDILDVFKSFALHNNLKLFVCRCV